MKKSQNHALKYEVSETSHAKNIQDVITPSTMDSTYLVAVACAAASGRRKAIGVFGFNTGKFGDDILQGEIFKDRGRKRSVPPFKFLWRVSVLASVHVMPDKVNANF